jgi:Protein of unknown function (DUF3592)
MSVVIGFWFAVAGGVAALAGLTARDRVRRLRRSGTSAWAMVVPSPVPPDEPGGGQERRTMIQYSLADGRVVERLCPRPVRRSAWPAAGQRVRVWYDPADPADVLVNGWDGRYSDWALLAVGLSFFLFGLAIAFGH